MLHGLVGFPRGPSGKESACQFRRRKEMWVRSLGQEDLLEKVMASILAWRIPRTEEPGGLQSIESQRVRHNQRFSTQACTSASQVSSPGLFGLQCISMPMRCCFPWARIWIAEDRSLKGETRKVSHWGKERRALRTKRWHPLILSGVFPGSLRSTLLW